MIRERKTSKVDGITIAMRVDDEGTFYEEGRLYHVGQPGAGFLLTARFVWAGKAYISQTPYDRPESFADVEKRVIAEVRRWIAQKLGRSLPR